jgi:4F5 protein related disordered region
MGSTGSSWSRSREPLVYCVLSATLIRVVGAADEPKSLEPIHCRTYLRSVIHRFEDMAHGLRLTNPRDYLTPTDSGLSRTSKIAGSLLPKSLVFTVSVMGGGNGAKAAQKRERNAAKNSKSAGSQLKSNEAAKTILCVQCKTSFLGTMRKPALSEHAQVSDPTNVRTADLI